MKEIDEITMVPPSYYKRLEQEHLLKVETLASIELSKLVEKTQLPEDILINLKESAVNEMALDKERKRRFSYISWLIVVMLALIAVMFSSTLSDRGIDDNKVSLSPKVNDDVQTIENSKVNNNDDVNYQQQIDVVDNIKTVSANEYYQLAITFYADEKYTEAADFVDRGFTKGIENADLRFLRGWLFKYAGKNDAALNQYKLALRHDKNYASAMINIGLIYKDQNKYALAKKYLSKALVLKPTDSTTLDNLAYLYHIENNLDKSKEILTKAIKYNKYRVYPHYLLGMQYALKNKHNLAIASFINALTVSPDDVNTLTEITHSYYALGDYELVSQNLDKLLSQGVKQAWIYNLRGSVLMEQGKPDVAINDFLEAIKLDASFKYAYANLGRIYLNKKEYLQSEKYLNTALDLDPKYIWALKEKGTLLQNQKKYDAANKQYIKIVNINSKDADAYANIGWGYYKQDKFNQAYDFYLKALTLDQSISWIKDDFVWVAVRLANSLMYNSKENPNYSKAENYYRIAIQYKPDYLWAHSNLARLYKIGQKYKVALKHIETALQIDIKDGFSHSIKGQILHNLNRLKEARSSYEKALKLGVGVDESWIQAQLINIMMMEEENHDYEELIKKINQLIIKYPNSSSLYQSLSLAESYLKKYDDALVSIDKAISLFGKPVEQSPWLSKDKAMLYGYKALEYKRQKNNKYIVMVDKANALVKNALKVSPNMDILVAVKGWLANEVEHDFHASFNLYKKLHDDEQDIVNIANLTEASLIVGKYDYLLDLSKSIFKKENIDKFNNRQSKLVVIYIRFIAYMSKGDRKAAKSELMRLSSEYSDKLYPYKEDWTSAGVRTFLRDSKLSNTDRRLAVEIALIIQNRRSPESILKLKSISNSYKAQ